MYVAEYNKACEKAMASWSSDMLWDAFSFLH